MRYIFLLFSFLFITQLSAQDQELLASPYHTMRTLLANLQDDTTNIQIARKPFAYSGVSTKKAGELAVQLKQVLDGTGIYIDMSALPKNNNYFDSTLQKHRYVLSSKYSQIYLERVDGMWIFPAATLPDIEMAHEELFRFGTDALLNLLPKMGTREIFGLHLYQYLAILILVLISVIVHKVFSLIFNRLLLTAVKKSGREHLADGYLVPIASPISWFVTIGLAAIVIPALQLPVTLSHYIVMGLDALLPLFGTIVFYRLADILALYLKRMAEKTESSLDDQLVPLFRKTLKTFVVIIGTLFILDNLEINIIPVLTGLSIGGLAFALAAQDTIKNFFGSLMIFIDKPFQIGDWITTGEIDGTVEEVGFRSSRIRTFRNSLMYVPNGKLADRTIDNNGLRMYRRFYTKIAVTYDTPTDVLETFIQGLRKIVDRHPKTWKDNYHIYFNDMEAYSLQIMFYIFFAVPSWAEELKCRHEVLMEVMKLAKELGINFAFPTQTLHMENFPGQPSLSPGYVSTDEAEKRLQAYFGEAEDAGDKK